MINWFKRISKKFINFMKSTFVIIKDKKELWISLITIFVIIIGIFFGIETYEWIAILLERTIISKQRKIFY
ncbi:MAG: hypothetical protein TYPL_4530 [Candidatus Tyloplasma litorale]|nr:MAG: hypothetical protein TYPL_4530 [Mycoplasmatales bacterium]